MRIVCALALALVTGGSALAQTTPSAQRVLDRARVLTGGAAAWNRLRGLHQTGDIDGVKFERWLDPLRYGLRAETQTPDGGKLVQGYNGYGEWRILADGQSTGSAEAEDVAEIRSEAFFAAFGFFYPSRFNVRITTLPPKRYNGFDFDVLKVEPAGGEPREVWFARKTGMLSFIVDDVGPKRSRADFSDWRKEGVLTLPGRITYIGGGRESREVMTFTAFEFTPVDRAMFSLPRPD